MRITSPRVSRITDFLVASRTFPDSQHTEHKTMERNSHPVSFLRYQLFHSWPKYQTWCLIMMQTKLPVEASTHFPRSDACVAQNNKTCRCCEERSLAMQPSTRATPLFSHFPRDFHASPRARLSQLALLQLFYSIIGKRPMISNRHDSLHREMRAGHILRVLITFHRVCKFSSANSNIFRSSGENLIYKLSAAFSFIIVQWERLVSADERAASACLQDERSAPYSNTLANPHQHQQADMWHSFIVEM
jgi:hypothetical protein